MKTFLFVLRLAILLGLWITLGTVADFTFSMWQTWVIIIAIALYSSLGTVEDRLDK